jgi:two-component system CheB/CheR fusion protein
MNFSNDQTPAQTGQHYIIAIGASAGGMEVIHELFDAMPDNTGFSFIVIQHLSPDYKSLLAELLSKHTMMQVHEAEDGMELKPNNVYVIPSKKIMTVEGLNLRLKEKIKSVQPNDAIDVFLTSLAEQHTKNAVAIILSGTGSDGTRGIQEIKKNGGLVVVQDPITANFDGMPNNAIATGCVDLILPADLIAEEVVSYLKDQPLYLNILPGTFEGKDELIFRDILHILNKSTKQDFTYYKRPTLLRRLSKRMVEVNINDLNEYKNYLQSHDGEIKKLCKEFLINVTKFFRDPVAFDFLRTDVLPQIFSQKKDDDSIKIWSAGCSTGEEAYSLAILFNEYAHKINKPNLNIKIFATDIDASCLEVASRATYNESVSKDVPPDILKKHFIHQENSYRISPAIRKMVVFANHDVIKDPPFSKLDLVVCRNMLIYINPVLQKKILRKFHFALSLNSYLFLGPSENIGPLKDVVEEKSRKWKIFRCMNKALTPEKDLMMSALIGKTIPNSFTKTKKKEIGMADLLQDTLLSERKIACLTLDTEFNLKNANGKFKSFINLPDDTFNINVMKLVPRDLSVALGIALRKSSMQTEPVSMKRIVVHDGENERYINLIARYIPTEENVSPFYFVIIEEQNDLTSPKKIVAESISASEKIEDLELELKNTRDTLQSVIEEMESTNEELQSSNEEMISTNEELQSTNEELQSLNEELHTVSAEHQAKIRELLELNDDLDNAFRTSDLGQVFVDKNLLIKKFNPHATRIVNLISSDIGRSIMDITNRIHEFNLVNDLKHVMKSSMQVEKEIAVDDKYFYLVRISPYVKRDNSVEGAVITFIDINHSKKLTGLIDGIFNSTANGIAAKQAVRDEQGRIVDFKYSAANPAFAHMFATEVKYIIGKSFVEIYDEHPEMHFDAYKYVVETGKQKKLEYYNKTMHKWFETTIVKMFDGIVANHVDITERKEAADIIANNYEELKKTTHQLRDSNIQLERSNLDLMQFASVASHDLKEPLRKIQTFGNILQSKLKDRLIDGELNYLSKMISASGRMQTLIEDVLTLSKLSNGNYVFAQVNLKKIVRRITDDLEITIQEKHAKVNIGQLPDVYGIAGQLHQLFQNLISNSLKFCDKETPVISIVQKDISQVNTNDVMKNPQDYYCIQVIDNGIGFDEIYLDKIFGIFQRIHGRQFDGTGIGLAIAKKIIENHHGYITAQSELGNGATFSIFLPKENPQVN